MRFFNIREQVVSLVMPDGKTAVTFNFKQNPADAMLQELTITDPRGGPTALLIFDKAGGLRESRWEGVNGAPAGDPDAAQLDQQQADELKLKPGQKTVDSGGRLIQAPGKAAGGQRGPTAGQDGGAQAAPVESANTNPPGGAPLSAENPGVPDSSQDPNRVLTPDEEAQRPADATPPAALNTPETLKARPPRTP